MSSDAKSTVVSFLLKEKIYILFQISTKLLHGLLSEEEVLFCLAHFAMLKPFLH